MDNSGRTEGELSAPSSIILYRNERITDRNATGESWVEISSQPSSSSLSSIDNEIITTGLRVQPLDLRRHRRNTTLDTSTAAQVEAAVRRTTSSQDEYDESSSDDDAERRVRSMGEGLQIRTGRLSPRLQMAGLRAEHVCFPSPSDEDEDDEDEEGTALGITQPKAISTPQPRAAGIGATPRGTRDTERDSYFPPQSRAQRFSETAHRAANDEALRASLTTLLRCAQAARSLPKPPYAGQTATRAAGGNEVQEFRLLPEAEVLGPAPPATTATQPSVQSPSTRPRSSATASADEKEKKEKRKSGLEPSKTKKKRPSTHVHSTESGAQVHQVLTQNVSPTLLTWIVSAGVVVFVSVVGFGAGYAMGFEAGKEEGKLLGCGREVPVRVRRFRWGIAG